MRQTTRSVRYSHPGRTSGAAAAPGDEDEDDEDYPEVRRADEDDDRITRAEND